MFGSEVGTAPSDRISPCRMSPDAYREELRAVGQALRATERHGSCLVLRFVPGGNLTDRLAAIVRSETRAHPALAMTLQANPAEVVLTVEPTDGDESAMQALVAAMEAADGKTV